MKKILLIVALLITTVSFAQDKLVTLSGKVYEGKYVGKKDTKIEFILIGKTQSVLVPAESIQTITLANGEILDIISEIKSSNNQITTDKELKSSQSNVKSEKKDGGIIYNPCNDERYLQIKQKSFEEMSDREYDYFKELNSECIEFKKKYTNSNVLKESKNDKPSSVLITAPLKNESIDSEITTSVSPEGFGYIRGGLDILGVMDFDGDFEDDVDFGFCGIFEFYTPIEKSISIGGGLEYQTFRKVKDLDGKFNFMAFFAGIRLYQPDISSVYSVLKLGINWLKVDDDWDGGFVTKITSGNYYAIGAGLILEDGLEIEILWSNNSGKVEGNIEDAIYLGWGNYEDLPFSYNVDYSKLTISIGMNLNSLTKIES